MDAYFAPNDLNAARAAAAAMNCECYGSCAPKQALDCLYRKTLEVLSRSAGDYAARLALARPLGTVQAHQKTRLGQRECSAYAETLAAGDPAGALAACLRMIERQRALE
jgi:hypothetical protein